MLTLFIKALIFEKVLGSFVGLGDEEDFGEEVVGKDAVDVTAADAAVDVETTGELVVEGSLVLDDAVIFCPFTNERASKRTESDTNWPNMFTTTTDTVAVVVVVALTVIEVEVKKLLNKVFILFHSTSCQMDQKVKPDFNVPASLAKWRKH